jgi:hypothetical protein
MGAPKWREILKKRWANVCQLVYFLGYSARSAGMDPARGLEKTLDEQEKRQGG